MASDSMLILTTVLDQNIKEVLEYFGPKELGELSVLEGFLFMVRGC